MRGGEISETENESHGASSAAAEFCVFGFYVSRGGFALSRRFEGRGGRSKHHAHTQMEFQSQWGQTIPQPPCVYPPTALPGRRRRDPPSAATATQTTKSHHRSRSRRFHHPLPSTSTIVGFLILSQRIGDHEDLGTKHHGRRTQHRHAHRFRREDHRGGRAGVASDGATAERGDELRVFDLCESRRGVDDACGVDGSGGRGGGERGKVGGRGEVGKQYGRREGIGGQNECLSSQRRDIVLGQRGATQILIGE
mmetsp:Transcript_8993/g.19139  ORF Transcript_8993/g.19139 Transcript_8993/m.19139 type:complete len:252 (+) Transcript_8993:258-1013(+)